jgi:predicted dehydrogenase
MALGIYWDALRPWFGDATRVLATASTFTPRRSEVAGGREMNIELPDAVTVIAQTSAGVVITCVQSGVAHFGYERIEIYGEEGTLVCSPQGELLGGRSGEGELHPLAVPPGFVDGWRVEENFIRLVRGDAGEGVLTFEDGIKNIEFLEAVHLSSRDGRWVPLPLP